MTTRGIAKRGRQIAVLLFFLFFFGQSVVLRSKLESTTAETVDAPSDSPSLLPSLKENKDSDLLEIQQANLGTNKESLLSYLFLHSKNDLHLAALKATVQQLGSNSFRERQKATEDIVPLGLSAVTRLLEARQDANLELCNRIDLCLDRISQNADWTLPLLVVRQVKRQAPAKGLEALLRYLPYAPDSVTQEEIWYAIESLQNRTAKVSSALVAAIKDPLEARRALAGCIVAAKGTQSQKAFAKRLLTDPDPWVRLRTAQGFLAGKEKSVVPVLIDLLDENSVFLLWQVEELLHWAAGHHAPSSLIGTGTPEAKRKAKQGWLSWWEKNSSGLDLSRLGADHRRPGLVLLCDVGDPRSSPERQGKCILLGCDGEPRWQMTRLQNPRHVELNGDDRVLLSEGGVPNVFGPLDKPTRVSERHLDGKIIWQKQAETSSRATAHWLPNGDRLLVVNGRIWERKPNGQETEFVQNSLILDAQKLSNHLYVYIRRPETEDCVSVWARTTLPGRTEELAVPLNGSPKTILSAGRFQIGPTVGNSFDEVDGRGRICRRWKAPEFSTSIHQLSNGNVILTQCEELGYRCFEVNGCRQAVWETFFPEGPSRVQPCFGLVRFGFDHERDNRANLDGVPYRIMALKHRNPLARAWSAMALAKARLKLRSAIPSLLEASSDPDPRVSHWASNALFGMGPIIIHDLVKALESPNPKLRVTAASMGLLRWAELEQAAPFLLNALKDDNADVRKMALISLTEIWMQRKTLHLPFNALLKDENKDIREAAARALGILGKSTQDSISALLDRFQDPLEDAEVRKASAEALLQLGSKNQRVRPVLLRSLQAETEARPIRLAIAARIAEFGLPSDLPLLLNALKRENRKGLGRDWPLCCALIGGIYELDPDAEDLASDIIHFLKNRDLSIGDLERMAHYLGKLGEKAKEAVPTLVALLNHSSISPDFRQEKVTIGIIEALAQIGPEAKDAFPGILGLLKPDKVLRFPSVLRVVSKMGPKGKPAVPALLQLLNDPRVRNDLNFRDFRDDIIRALGHVTPLTEEAQTLLLIIKNEENDAARKSFIDQVLRKGL